LDDGNRFLVDGQPLPRSLGAHINHYSGIMAHSNCDVVHILCGGGCVAHHGLFPKWTHPHVVIYASEDIASGSEICIDYGEKYWKTMGGAGASPQRSLVADVLAADPAEQAAVLAALLARRDAAQPIPPSACVDPNYLKMLRDADDPVEEFVSAVQTIQEMTRRLTISTAISIGDSVRGSAFPLSVEISPRYVFEQGLVGDVEKAARFLTQLRATSMLELQPVPGPKRPRGRPAAKAGSGASDK